MPFVEILPKTVNVLPDSMIQEPSTAQPATPPVRLALMDHHAPPALPKHSETSHLLECAPAKTDTTSFTSRTKPEFVKLAAKSVRLALLPLHLALPAIQPETEF